MGLIDLTSNLAIGAGENFSDHGGRHGAVDSNNKFLPHPSTHTAYDSVTPADVTAIKTRPLIDGTHFDSTTKMTSHVDIDGINYFSGIMGQWGGSTLPIGFTKNFTPQIKSKLAPGDPPTIVMESTTLSIPKTPATDGRYVLNTEPVGNYDSRLISGIPSQLSKTSDRLTINYDNKIYDLDNQLGKGNNQFNSTTVYLPKTNSTSGGYLLSKYSKSDGEKYGTRLTNSAILDINHTGIYAGEVTFGKKLNIHDGSNRVIKQPFITKRIGDRWGIDTLGDMDLGIIRGGFNTTIARTLADEIRLSKYILTTKGILFGLKQVVLQRFNTKAETRLWNPLSIFGSAIPTIHINRHVSVWDESAMHDLRVLAKNPYGWAKSKLTDLTSPEGNIVKPSKTSLMSHFNKEAAILKFNAGPRDLVSKLQQKVGISIGAEVEKSRQMDDEQFKWNSLNRATLDTGDQGTPGVVHMNYDLTMLGVTYIDNVISNPYITSKVDRVNALPYGSIKDFATDNALEPTTIDGTVVKDFIPFKFYDKVNNKWIIFRASLSGISDNISPEWSEEKYIGRPDKVYTYQGVDRSISFTFQIYPKTKQELPILWEKLNYLVGLCYPSWDNNNRMLAPFIDLTIGNLWKDTPGKLDSLSVTIEDSGTWEYDEHFKLPKYITVSVDFTYIGKYKPEGKGKHYELDWISGPKFNYYPERSGNKDNNRAINLKDLYKKLGQG